MLLKSYRFGIVLAAGITLFAGLMPAGQKLEGLLLHLGSRLMHEQPQGDAVVVVAIDDKSIDALGAWPWPRDRLAEVIDRLSRFKPKTIGLMLPMAETETTSGIAVIKRDLATLAPAARKTADKWLEQLDTDARFARSLDAAGNVVLAAPYRTVWNSGLSPQALNGLQLKSEQEVLPWYQLALHILQSAQSLPDHQIAPLMPLFTDKAIGIGLSPIYTNEQWVHGSALAVDVGNRYLPGFALSLWATTSDSDVKNIRVSSGMALHTAKGEQIGAVDLAWYPHPLVAPPVYSLSEIMRSDSLARTLGNKMLLLGLTGAGLAPVIIGPAGNRYTPVTWSAKIVAGMLAGSGIAMPVWFYAAQRLLVILFALYLVFIPVSWHGTRGLLVSLALTALVVNLALVSLMVKNLWLPVIMPVIFLLVVQLMLFLSWYLNKGLVATRQALLDTRMMLATNLQSQGQLDHALEHYIQCLPDRAVLQPLYDLGLEYERHRQVGKAQVIYAELLACTQGFRDVKQRCAHLAALSDRFPSSVSSDTGKTLLLDAPAMERPVLGRYRVERELGQGAMGTVYLAVDPTIGREVAIKTLPLLQTYEGAGQAAVTERFFQEAEAAGRLDHPHIVTVYDAGKEHDLAYIAMDYIPGSSLDQYTGKADLLPVWEVLEVAAQVADALGYAHERNVVHRDIKPGNIMYDRDNAVAKITDFGIARLLDTSRTRTGTILGSPSYMSPEQVAGKKTDGRSDLFSLGVTLYQLLSGCLPFKGDSVATLMYQIANQKTPTIRKARSGLPISISRLINKSLQKSPANRFENGAAMAEVIRKCRAQFRSGRKKTA
ncbi:Serine/threonine protein kinase [hydrothermal vent metagenome]|uniref:Serine/threonine protein kinase n=1 Tax=hydrothermal vent metagenome TaxID=652676 RepID=A0A3B0Z6H6_9ZZZZ